MDGEIDGRLTIAIPRFALRPSRGNITAIININMFYYGYTWLKFAVAGTIIARSEYITR